MSSSSIYEGTEVIVFLFNGTGILIFTFLILSRLTDNFMITWHAPQYVTWLFYIMIGRRISAG